MTKFKPLLSFCHIQDNLIDMFNVEQIQRTGSDCQILHRSFRSASDRLSCAADCIFGIFLDGSVGHVGLMTSSTMRISVPKMFQHLVPRGQACCVRALIIRSREMVFPYASYEQKSFLDMGSSTCKGEEDATNDTGPFEEAVSL